MKSAFLQNAVVVQYGLTLAFLMVFCGMATAQSRPVVVTKQAPLCSDPILNNCYTDDAPYYYYSHFVMNELPFLSGVGTAVQWASIDACTVGGVMGANSKHCVKELHDMDDQCPNSPNFINYFWCTLDQELLNYINLGAPFANKKIVLIIQPTNDSMTNNGQFTPGYVFTSTWANTVSGSTCGSSCNPQDMVVCKGWPGDIGLHTCPVQESAVPGSGDFAIWNATTGNCTFNIGGVYSCPCSGKDDSGFPVVYEPPFMVAYQDFLAALAFHYNPVTGSTQGATIAPYIAYARVGLANADENLPACTSSGNLQQDTWVPGTQFPAGYLVNSGNTQYVATGAGTTGTTAMPTCSPAGCTTAPDNTISGWYNAGPYTPAPPPNAAAIWPGPGGEFGPLLDPGDYWDNGYLARWSPHAATGLAGTLGYVASMLAFLNGLGASFPFDISAHEGPPDNNNTAYADSEAAIASANGIGFGMQSVNIGDTQTYAAQTFPLTREDWAHNFQAYPAPVHHLQMDAPGTKYFAEGYAIQPSAGIDVDMYGNATINCTMDCTPFSRAKIYISGNSNNALNGIWAVTCGNPGNPCPTTLTSTYYGLIFSSGITSGCPMPPVPCGTGGIVWGPDYWPITMPFAVQHGASFIEVWECSLDYAFNTISTYQSPTNAGTTGCASWGVLPAGGDPSYKGTLGDAQIGQPSATSVRTGNSVLVNGKQF
jgi:hypothetical protein